MKNKLHFFLGESFYKYQIEGHLFYLFQRRGKNCGGVTLYVEDEMLEV